jgi:signal-transduction protein with cAMP-binding, CBS, and nucleotidyltransferase domain
MNDIEKLQYALGAFAGLTPEDFGMSAQAWKQRVYKKGEFYNMRQNVCSELSFILNGAFRSYTIDERTGDEKNVFLYTANGFVVTFKSFINQVPCDYYTQALEDSLVLAIHLTDLQRLYAQSHAWEKFGRLLAQEAFNVTMTRIEGFIFKSPEERYLDLVRDHPDIFNSVPLYHISSYLGIQGPSLSRIRKRISGR